MAIESTENYSGRRLSKSNTGWTATRIWIVSGATTETQSLSATPLAGSDPIPSVGNSHPQNATLKVASVDTSMIGPRTYQVTVSYNIPEFAGNVPNPTDNPQSRRRHRPPRNRKGGAKKVVRILTTLIRLPGNTVGIQGQFRQRRQNVTDAAAAESNAAKQDARAEGRKLRQDEADAEKGHSQAILTIRAKAASDRLRALGKDREAEDMDRRAAFAQRLQEIRDQAEREIREDAENAPAIKRRAVEAARAAAEGYDAESAVDERQRGRQFEASRPGVITGETRLLSGVTGSQSNPLVEPARITATNSVTQSKVLAGVLAEIQGLRQDLSRAPTLTVATLG